MDTGAAVWDFDIIGETGRIRILNNCLQAELTLMQTAEPDAIGARSISNRFPVTLPAVYPYPWPAHIQGTGLSIIDDLASCIESGGDPQCSGEDGRAALEVAIAMRESHRAGGVKVSLPLEDRSLRILSSEIHGDEVPRRWR